MESSDSPDSLPRYRPSLQRSGTLPVARDSTFLAVDTPASDQEIQNSRLALRDHAQVASRQLLELMHGTRDHLRFWQELQQSPVDHHRVLLLQTGAKSFIRYAQRWIAGVLGYGPPAELNANLMVASKVKSLQTVYNGLAIALGEIHIQADVVTRAEVDRSALDTLGSCTAKMQAAISSLADLHATSDVDVDDTAGGSSLLMLPRTPKSKTCSGGLPAMPEVTEKMYDVEQLQVQVGALESASRTAVHHINGVIQSERSPSKEERTWIYRAARRVCLCATGAYLVFHSPLCGSDDLQRWFQSIFQSIRGFFTEHLLDPVKQIVADLQDTFAANNEVDKLVLEESRDILHRMLQEFQSTRRGGSGTATSGATSDLHAMELVLKEFEAEAKSPIRNLITGDLSNLMMIQMQSMKVQMESALLAMDRILEANEMNFAAMAAMPFFAVLYGMVVLMRRLAMRTAVSQARRRDQHQYARLLLVEVERAVLETKYKQVVDPFHMGCQIFALNALYMDARDQRPQMSAVEWESLNTDILEIASPQTPVDRKLRILQRMSYIYSMFRSD